MTRGGGFYEVLGVPDDASTETIRDAYRERVKEVHPGRSDAPDAAERFKRLKRAKEVLTDPDERARYDRLGHGGYVGGGSPSASSDAANERPPGGPTRSGNRRTRGRTRPGDAPGADAGPDARRSRRQRESTGRRDDRDAVAHGDGYAAENYDTDWYASGASSDAGYRISPGGGAGVEPERIGLAAAGFLLYPVFAVGAFAPWLSPWTNAAVGLLGFALVVFLLWTPEAGVLAFGCWAVLAPVALAAAGIGVVSLTGVLAWSACWIPFLLSVAGLLVRYP